MNGTELTFTIATCLLVAVLVGWAMRWAFERLKERGAQEDPVVAELRALKAQFETVSAERAEFERLSLEKDAEISATMDALRHARQTAQEWQDAYEQLNSGDG